MSLLDEHLAKDYPTRSGPLSVLRDQSNNYAGENFEGFTITKFDGTTVTV